MKKVASVLLAAALASWGATPKQKLSPDAAAKVDTAEPSVKVIVQWKIHTGSATRQKIAALGGQVVSEFKAIDSGVYTIPSSALNALSADSSVEYVSLDRAVHKKLAYTAAAVNAYSAWKAGDFGLGVGVAVIDSGINADPNLGVGSIGGIVYTEDFTVPSGQPTP
ncbi:MAG: hypothetical protein JOZ62_06680, partial [Acidobacteriaceae bacterium]|nr:hypothetical protein [Acidobacteriaceae bacterium]